MKNNLWIILVDYNGIEDTRTCLRSLQMQSSQARVVVVDNASRDDVAAALAVEFPWADFIRSERNGGWAGGNNLGMKYALERGAEAMVLLNNDTIVATEFIVRMAAALQARPDYGILGPIIRFMAPPHEVQTDGVKFNRPTEIGFFQRHRIAVEEHAAPNVVEVDIVNGCCLAVRREVVSRVGFIDEDFFLIHEESDFCLRSQAAGFKNGVISEALIWHKGSSSFQREGKRLQRYFDSRNLIRLISKHGRRKGSRGPLRSYGHHLRYAYHRYAVERESNFTDSAKAVLEGLYDGYLGRWGPYPAVRRPGISVASWVFDKCWRFGSSKSTDAKRDVGHVIAGPPPPIPQEMVKS